MSGDASRPREFEEIARQQQRGIEAHAQLRESRPYVDATMRIERITIDFVETVRAAWLFATRDPNFDRYVFWRFTDDLIASALAVWMTSRDGIDTVPRRELRFMLELAVRNAYVDLKFASACTPLETRMAYVEHRLGQEDIGLLDDLPLTVYWADPSPLIAEVKNRLYGELSKYVHPSHQQMERRLALADRGVYLGFETAAELEEFADLLLRTYDILLAIVFTELGPSSTDDLCSVIAARPQWSFSTTRFVSEIAAELSRS